MRSFAIGKKDENSPLQLRASIVLLQNTKTAGECITISLPFLERIFFRSFLFLPLLRRHYQKLINLFPVNRAKSFLPAKDSVSFPVTTFLRCKHAEPKKKNKKKVRSEPKTEYLARLSILFFYLAARILKNKF